MSFNTVSRAARSGFEIDDLIEASRSGVLTTPNQPGRRAQRKAIKKRMTQASMIAPLLAAEGCLTLGGKGSPLATEVSENTNADSGSESVGAGAGVGESVVPPVATPDTPPSVQSGRLQARDDANFETAPDNGIQISANDLLENDQLPRGLNAEVVRVFSAENGTVTLNDGVIQFIPDAGFSGAASFRYEVRDANGNISQAEVAVDVAMPDHAMGDHDDNMGDGMDNGMHGDGMHGNDMHGDMSDGGHVHPDNPAMAGEHMALMNLVPVAEATHVAVQNGSWFDPATWASGEVPGDGAKVLISQGLEVTYDGQSPASLFTVRVDGALEFATNADTFMEVDTLVVSPSGTLTIGTADNPVAANVETVIQIADNGPIDVAWDPTLVSRGVISHGTVEIHGAEKEAFLSVATDPMAGDTSLTVSEAPAGWQVGDKLVLTGTHLTEIDKPSQPGVERTAETEDEELTITRIEGNTIHFDKALEFDHDTPRADLKAYVANYSRNIRIETENADSVPEHQRGHVMLMHSDNIDVRYAEFHELGRTDKSERAFDVGDINNVQSDDNVKGRYSLHIHRAGVSDADDPAYLVGNAVWGSPGWGFVHHDSNAVLADNAAYDVYGAAFVAETGNEIGRWANNIAIKSIGNTGGAKYAEDVLAFDLGRTGAGFWFQGRLVDAVDNVAAGVPGGHGFVYMSRGNQTIPVLAENVHQQESLRYVEEAAIHIPAINQFDGNVAFAVKTGVEVIKANSEQGHDVRSVLENFTAWEVSAGVHLQYTAHYTLSNLDLIATDQSGGGDAPWRGIIYGPNTIDVTVNNANISGFPVGVDATREAININHPFDGNFGYVFIDVNVDGAGQDFNNAGPDALFLTGDQLSEGRLSFESDINGIPVTPTPESRGYFDLSGTKTDSIGDTTVSPTWDPHRIDYFNVVGAIKEEGYWTLPDGRQVTYVEQYFADRATGFLNKESILVEFPRDPEKIVNAFFPDAEVVYNGVLDLDNEAPVTRDDFITVGENGSITFDPLANDFDPEGDALDIDGLIHASNGKVFQNDDGTLTYTPDPNFTGTDIFCYWVEDTMGNQTMGMVNINVEV